MINIKRIESLKLTNLQRRRNRLYLTLPFPSSSSSSSSTPHFSSLHFAYNISLHFLPPSINHLPNLHFSFAKQNMSFRQRQQSSSSNIYSNPLNSPPPPPPPPPSSSISQRALQSTAHLANLLPTGTLLAFQLLTPLFTSNGVCDSATRPLTFILLIVLSFSCFLACFTDSFKGSDGQIYYGFATPNGLWVFDSEAAKGAGIPDLRKYKLGFIDVVHAVLSVIVFFAVAFRDKNVINCFYPAPKHETEEVLDIVPIGVGLICSLLFVVFPTRRHGIGFPVTSSDQTNHVS